MGLEQIYLMDFVVSHFYSYEIILKVKGNVEN